MTYFVALGAADGDVFDRLEDELLLVVVGPMTTIRRGWHGPEANPGITATPSGLRGGSLLRERILERKSYP